MMVLVSVICLFYSLLLSFTVQISCQETPPWRKALIGSVHSQHEQSAFM